jgi:hypothetical protein
MQKLRLALGEVARKPHPVPVLRALEESVTLNLTAHALSLAQTTLTKFPELRSELQRDKPIWTGDWCADAIAEAIRSIVRSCDAALAISTSGIAERHDHCLIFLVTAMTEVAQASGSSATATRAMVVDSVPSADNALSNSVLRMQIASGLLKSFLSG